jgi:hypothetical protein
MEAAFIDKSFLGYSFKEVMAAFFENHTPDSTKILFWKLFQCWARKDCKELTEVSDEDLALFLDQLIALVAAAYIEHQANRASENRQKGGSDE